MVLKISSSFCCSCPDFCEQSLKLLISSYAVTLPCFQQLQGTLLVHKDLTKYQKNTMLSQKDYKLCLVPRAFTRCQWKQLFPIVCRSK